MNISNMTIGQRIISGFTLVTIVSGAALGLGYLEMSKIRVDADKITGNAMPGLQAIGEIGDTYRASYGATLEHVITEDPAKMAAIDKKITQLRDQITNAFANYEKTIVGDVGRQIFDATIAARKDFVDTRNEVVKLSTEGKKAEAKALCEGKLQVVMASYEAAVKTMYDRKQENAAKSGQDINIAVTAGQMSAAIGGGLAVLLSVGIAWLISHSTNRKLRDVSSLLSESTLQVASAAGQVSGASQSLAEGASEQAASLEETSASLEEISSMTKQNANNALEAKQTANEARSDAEVGANDMRDMKAAMDDIKAASDNIAKIIKTIDEIAFQTNILALNAAVEAARAGDAGMGFAVVADEVRNLAQRSAVAAKETAQKIEDCILKSETGVGITAKVSQSLEQILAKNRRVDDLVGEIANASREQSQGIDQVNTAVTQMDKVTQSNAASAEESASAAEELNGQAEALKEAVADLEKLVGGGSNTAQASKPQTYTAKPSKRMEIHRAPSPLKIKSNGNHPAQRQTKPGKASIPLEDAFTDF